MHRVRLMQANGDQGRDVLVGSESLLGIFGTRGEKNHEFKDASLSFVTV